MAGAASGLTRLTLEELKQLLRYVHRDELQCPVNIVELARLGFQNRAEILLHVFRGLDARAVQAVVTSVIAERLK
jgi:hypothetical protein